MFKFARRSEQGPPLIFSMIWLVYLIFPLYALFQQPADEIAEGLLVVLLFIALYVSGSMYARARLIAIIGLIAITGVFCYVYDASGLYMAFYPTPLIGMLKSRRQAAVGYVLLIALFVFDFAYWNVFADQDMTLQLLPAVVIMLVMPLAFKLGRRSKELRAKLNLANEEIARLSKNEERQRISRDLHDTLGHTLTLITLKSELAEKLIAKNPERAAIEVRDIQATSRAALKQVRELISGMNAVTLRVEVDHAKQILAAAGIVLEQRGIADGEVPSPLIDNILGMCLRESVTNVVKHSRARLCTVELARDGGSLRLSVEDDGTGLPARQDPDGGNAGAAGNCNGMKGMRDRLKLIEGVMTASVPASGKGTRLVFAVPLVDKAGKEGSP